MKYILTLLIGITILAPTQGVADDTREALRLTLPSVFYAVPGIEMSLYYDNVVLTETPEKYRFEVTCDVGTSKTRRWTVTPTAADVGDHKVTVTISQPDGKELEKAVTTLKVVPAKAGAGSDTTLLIIGDSLTHATLYPNEIARLLSLPGNPSWKMLGTHRPKSAADGVAHEGYGGWTWQRFATHYEPKPDGTYRKRSSPFVSLGEDGAPKLDLNRYFRQECGDNKPDFVIIMLGINDCFSANSKELAAIDNRIDAMFAHAKTLVTEIRRAVPKAEVGICLTTPPNSREAAFQANYKGRYPRWGWKRIQHRLVERQIKHFGNRQKDRISLIPTELNLDPVDGYPSNNGVHPNQLGYKQIAASIFSWLKARLQHHQSVK